MPSGGTFDLPALRARLADLEVQMQQPGFWERPDAARQVSQEVARIRARMEEVERLERELADLLELAELASADDAAVLADLEREVRAFGDRLDRIERATLLRGEHDARNAILSIHAGAGGTESQDWVEMLLRMYLRWAEEHGYRTEIVDVSPGEEAGLKSVTVIVSGPNAYGYLRGERGVHRLVRLSPFDAAHRRHTSFALVDVIPEVETAVRITHLPTGIVVQCQNERSQYANKLTAMKLLQARLFERQAEERRQKISAIRGEYREAAWGNQIRSYVLHPYTLVKDHRTGVETGNAQAVLDGALDPFIEAYLRFDRTPAAEGAGSAGSPS